MLIFWHIAVPGVQVVGNTEARTSQPGEVPSNRTGLVGRQPVGRSAAASVLSNTAGLPAGGLSRYPASSRSSTSEYSTQQADSWSPAISLQQLIYDEFVALEHNQQHQSGLTVATGMLVLQTLAQYSSYNFSVQAS